MLWYKSWLETRWRFFIGIALLLCSAAATVFTYPQVVKLLPLVPQHVDGELGRRIREAADLARDYRGYIWSNWFGQNLIQMSTIFAVLLGIANLLSGGALFTLSMPASRTRLLTTRAATGLAELFVLILVPSLVVPMLSPSIGETYGVGRTLIHILCAFIVAAAFFSFAFLLSTMFSDIWRPLLIALSIAAVIAIVEQFTRPAFGIFRVMNGETYFRSGALPWPGLVASVIVSAVLFSLAARNIARRDF